MLAQRLQAKPEPHEDPLLCGRLHQQEAAIFSQSPSTPPGCDVGYGEREFQRQLSASRLLLCFFWSCVSKFHGTLIPIVHAVRHNPAVSRNILTKWQPPIWLGYRKAGVLHAAPTPPTVVAQAWFYIKSIVVLLLINVPQQHFNFSVSFSFKHCQ